MSAGDLAAREAIRRTQAQYTMSGDSGRIEDMIATFTPDGVLEVQGVEHRGHEAIRALLSGVGARPDRPRPSPFFIRHHLTTVQIELTGPDEAAGRCYFLVFTPVGPDHAGRYSDRYRRAGDRWLIARRRITLDWAAADSAVGARAGDHRPQEA